MCEGKVGTGVCAFLVYRYTGVGVGVKSVSTEGCAFPMYKCVGLGVGSNVTGECAFRVFKCFGVGLGSVGTGGSALLRAGVWVQAAFRLREEED